MKSPNETNRTVALVARKMSSFLAPAAPSSVNVGLPTMAKELSIDALSLNWAATVYMVAAAMFERAQKTGDDATTLEVENAKGVPAMPYRGAHGRMKTPSAGNVRLVIKRVLKENRGPRGCNDCRKD